MKSSVLRFSAMAMLALAFLAGCGDDSSTNSPTSSPAPVVSTDPAGLVGSWELTGKKDTTGGETFLANGTFSVTAKMVDGGKTTHMKTSGTYSATSGQLITTMTQATESEDGTTWSPIPGFETQVDTSTFRIEDGTKLIEISKGDDGKLETEVYQKTTKTF